MTTSVKDSESEVALFLHQMIPHHQNAVNMAKGKLSKFACSITWSRPYPDVTHMNYSQPQTHKSFAQDRKVELR